MSLKRQESFHKLGQLLPAPALCISSLALRLQCAAAGKGPNAARFLQVERLTPRVWSWAGGHCISGATQCLLHHQRPAGDDCLLPETKILQFQLQYSHCFPGYGAHTRQDLSPLPQVTQGNAGQGLGLWGCLHQPAKG